MKEETITSTITGGIQAVQDDVIVQIPNMDSAIEGNDLTGIKEIWEKIKTTLEKIDWEKVKEILDNNPLPGTGGTGPDEVKP